MKKYRVGIIGCGVIAPNHLSVLSKLSNVDLVAVCDVVKDRADNKAKEYGCKAYYDYKEMIAAENLDSVHVCLPHYLHSEATVYSLKAGVDVLCEKPMDISYAKALEMKETADKCGRKLGIIFQNRYNPGTRFAVKLLNSGKIGALKGISANLTWCRDQEYYDQDAWRGKWATEGGGVLINQAIHTVDLTRYLTQSEVASVSASVSHRGNTVVEVEDTAEGIVKFENGTNVMFYFSNNCPRSVNIQVELFCEKGVISILGANATATYDDGTVEESYNDADLENPGKAVYGVGHFAQITEYYTEGAEDKVRKTLEEALKAQKLLEDIYNSAGIKRF